MTVGPGTRVQTAGARPQPHRDKKQGTIRSIELIREAKFPEELVLIDHNNEERCPRTENGLLGRPFEIYPKTKMDEQRMRHWSEVRDRPNDREQRGRLGHQRPVEGAQTSEVMRKNGISEEEVHQVVGPTPHPLAKSGRFHVADLDEPPVIDRTLKYEANSILRGEQLKAG